jgi:hypothetical protein
MIARHSAGAVRMATSLDKVRAVLRVIFTAGAVRRPVAQQRVLPKDARDLDQRVRECGEW